MKISMGLAKPEVSGPMVTDPLFDSDDEEEDAGLQEQIEAAYKTADTIDEMKLSETSSSSSSESSNSEDDNADPDETKQPSQHQETEGVEETGSGPDTTADPALEGSGNPRGPGPDVKPEENPSKTTGTKGKGPNSEKSGKAPATKSQLSTSAEGVRERAQTILFGGATLAQAMGSEEDVTRHLENYTGLLDGLQKLVGVMASGYENATEDIQSLVASTLDAATQRDRAFVAGASQALAEWTTTYQQAMSQGETGSIPEQLARWDRVREAGIALSHTVTSLTTGHKESTAPGEIFQRLLPACFEWVRVRTEATFSQLHTSLSTMLCRFVAPDQAGQIFSSIFTCMCNYNTEICGMAMAQTVVLVNTILNTYRVQQSLWESLCRTIPGIARNSLSEPRSAQLSRPSNPPVGVNVTLGASGSGDPGATATREGTQLASALQTSRQKRGSREKQHGEAPVRIPPAGSVWVARSEFQNLPVISLTGDDNPSIAQSQDTSTPLKATPVMGRRVSGGKINVSKVDAHHLLWKMEDRQEMARQRAEAKVSHRSSSWGQGSGTGLPYSLPATLPNLAAEEGISAKTLDPAPAAPKQGKKHSHADDDDEIMEIPVEDEPVVPPKKKKNKDKSKEEVPDPEVPDDGAHPGSSSAKPEETVKPKPAADPSGDPDKGAKQPKKKKKKKKQKEDPDLERFRQQERENKAKEMAKIVYRKLQRELDFRSVRNYRKTIPAALLETINGADHSKFLEEKLEKEGNYMSKKNKHRRNLMTVERLLSRIAKFSDDKEQRLKEAQSFIKSTFLKVQGMATTDRSSPRFVVCVLVDCFDEPIDCNHREYGKEQNIELHDVINPATMARVTAKGTYIVDDIPTTVKVDVAYCPFCNYTASHHRALNNHVRMHLRAILVCGWPGCYFVHMQAVHMIEHSAEVHGMARAKPAHDRGGD